MLAEGGLSTPPTEEEANRDNPTIARGSAEGRSCTLRVRQKGPIHFAGVWRPNSKGGTSVRTAERCWCYGGAVVGWEELHQYDYTFAEDPPSGLRLCQDGSIESSLYDANGSLCETLIDWVFETWPLSSARSGKQIDSNAITKARSLVCGDQIGCTIESVVRWVAYFALVKDKNGRVMPPDGFEVLHASETKKSRAVAVRSHEVTIDKVSELDVVDYGDCVLRWGYEYRVSHCNSGVGWRLDRERGTDALAAFWSRGLQTASNFVSVGASLDARSSRNRRGVAAAFGPMSSIRARRPHGWLREGVSIESVRT